MEKEATDLLKATIEEFTASMQEEKASRDFSREDISILYALAYSLYQVGDYVQAKQIFQQLILSKPMEQKFWIGLGSVLQMEKNYTRALTAWGMAALIADDEPLPHFHAAECLLSLGDVDEALKAFHAAKVRMKDKATSEFEQKIAAFQMAIKKLNHHEAPV